MPPHVHYVEPFAGGLSVLLAKDPEGVSEAVNDLDGGLVTFWIALRNPEIFQRLHRILEATPFCQDFWEGAHTAERILTRLWPAGRLPTALATDEDMAWTAAAFFIHCRQSLAGRGTAFAPLSKSRTRRGMNEQASAWIAAVDGLPAVHARLRRVVILNDDALKVIRREDSPSTLFYLDPPYHADTRTAPDVYAHEMTAEQHAALLDLLAGVRGKFLLSGYRSPAYDAAAAANGWHRVDFELPNNSAGGKAKRRMVESVWMNYPSPEIDA